jgi:hypothetical protein
VTVTVCESLAGSRDSTQALLGRGADPHAGERSAAQIAASFELEGMATPLATAAAAGQGD